MFRRTTPTSRELLAGSVNYIVIVTMVLLVAAIPLARRFEYGSIEGLIDDQKGPVQGAS